MGREQTSGSITLDLSGVAASVAEHVAPAFERLHREMTGIAATLAGPYILSQQESGDILQAFSPVVSLTEGRDLASRLAQAGYALVRVNSPERDEAAPAPTVTPIRSAEVGQSFFGDSR